MLPRKANPLPRLRKQKTGKNTKLCLLYSHISPYKRVYFSITLSTLPCHAEASAAPELFIVHDSKAGRALDVTAPLFIIIVA